MVSPDVRVDGIAAIARVHLFKFIFPQILERVQDVYFTLHTVNMGYSIRCLDLSPMRNVINYYCKFGYFREDFIFAKSVKRHI